MLRPADMTEIVHAAVANLRVSIEETAATITHDPLPVLTVDAARLIQVFQNLIGNAIKYSKPDEPPRVHVSVAHERNNTWTFSVQDNGVGFDPSYADQVFNMFKRLHGHEIAGTGIGLAICKKIVELHGGVIWAASSPGVGSNFSFTLPGRPA